MPLGILCFCLPVGLSPTKWKVLSSLGHVVLECIHSILKLFEDTIYLLAQIQCTKGKRMLPPCFYSKQWFKGSIPRQLYNLFSWKDNILWALICVSVLTLLLDIFPLYYNFTNKFISLNIYLLFLKQNKRKKEQQNKKAKNTPRGHHKSLPSSCSLSKTLPNDILASVNSFPIKNMLRSWNYPGRFKENQIHTNKKSPQPCIKQYLWAITRTIPEQQASRSSDCIQHFLHLLVAPEANFLKWQRYQNCAGFTDLFFIVRSCKK